MVPGHDRWLGGEEGREAERAQKMRQQLLDQAQKRSGQKTSPLAQHQADPLPQLDPVLAPEPVPGIDRLDPARLAAEGMQFPWRWVVRWYDFHEFGGYLGNVG